MRQQLLSLHRRLPRNHSASLAHGAAATVVVDRTTVSQYQARATCTLQLVRQDNNNTYLYMYNMHEKTMDAGCSLERPALPVTDSSNPFPLAFSTPPPPLGTPLSAPSPLLSWVRLFLLCRLHLLWVCFPLLHHPLSFSCGYASSCSVTPSPVSTLPYAPVGTLPSTPSPPSPVDTLPSAPSPPPPLCMLPSAPLSTLPFACHRTGQLQTWRP